VACAADQELGCGIVGGHHACQDRGAQGPTKQGPTKQGPTKGTRCLSPWLWPARSVGLNHLTRRRGLLGLVWSCIRVAARGKATKTPVKVFPTTPGVRIALTYGPDTDWVKSVVADGCELRTRGRTLHLAQPKIVHDPARTDTRPFERRVLQALQVEEFLDLTTKPESA
jgi:hypothetical protein